jgi:two-component system chemotaxis response regulator CheY
MDIGQLQVLKVLIVDDYEMIRTALKNSLMAIGVKNITEAANGAQAVQLIQQRIDLDKKFDIIFSDWNMPEMNGLELLQFCKANAAMKTTPFIMVTAESDQAAILAAVKSGVDDYVVKPFAPTSIQAKLARLLPSR